MVQVLEGDFLGSTSGTVAYLPDTSTCLPESNLRKASVSPGSVSLGLRLTLSTMDQFPCRQYQINAVIEVEGHQGRYLLQATCRIKYHVVLAVHQWQCCNRRISTMLWFQSMFNA